MECLFGGLRCCCTWRHLLIDDEASCEYEAYFLAARSRLGRRFRTLEHGNRVRDEGVRRFAWAVPSRAALDCIAFHVASLCSATPSNAARVLDFGAGSGYWAHCVERHCASLAPSVEAIDEQPQLYAGHSWFNVRKGGMPELRAALGRSDATHGAAGAAPSTLLLLIWPTWGLPMAAEAARLFHAKGGAVLVYVGEDRDGATAAPDFFDEVERSGRWCEEQGTPVHCWFGRADRLRVFKRSGSL